MKVIFALPFPCRRCGSTRRSSRDQTYSAADIAGALFAPRDSGSSGGEMIEGCQCFPAEELSAEDVGD